jgi:hypothetical protein
MKFLQKRIESEYNAAKVSDALNKANEKSFAQYKDYNEMTMIKNPEFVICIQKKKSECVLLILIKIHQ